MLITGKQLTVTLVNKEDIVEMPQYMSFHLGLRCLLFRQYMRTEVHSNFEILTDDRLICKMINPRLDGSDH